MIKTKMIKSIKSKYDHSWEGYHVIDDPNDIQFLKTSLAEINCTCEIENFYLRKEIYCGIGQLCIRIKIGDEYYIYPFNQIKEPNQGENITYKSLYAVFRRAVAPQIEMWKQMEFDLLEETGSFYLCPYSNQVVTWTNSHMHHVGKEFWVLVRDFLRSKRLDISDLELVNGDLDPYLLADWEIYHFNNAEVKLISALENMKIENANFQYIPVTNETPNHGAGVRKTMPCQPKPTRQRKKQKVESPKKIEKQSSPKSESKCNNPWFTFVKEWANKNDKKFWPSTKDPQCQADYKEMKTQKNHSKK